MLVAVLVLSFFTAQPASADPIGGEVAFWGGVAAVGGSGPLDLAGATAIDFTGALVVVSTGDFLSNGVTPVATPVDLTDFTFNPFSGPIDPLWVAGAFQFALDALTTVEQGTGYLVLAGTGVVSSSVAGLDDTAFSWNFSANNNGEGTLQLFTSTTSPTSVPEPSELLTFAFLTMGLCAFFAWSRRDATAVQ